MMKLHVVKGSVVAPTSAGTPVHSVASLQILYRDMVMGVRFAEG